MHRNSLTVSRRVQLIIKYSIKHLTNDLANEDFIVLIKLICHPFVTINNKELTFQLKSLESVLTEDKFQSYFEQNKQALQDFAIRKRTGILSPDKTLRAQAINIGVALAQ